MFLDSGILRSMFIAEVNGADWRQEIGLSRDFQLVTAQKCILEMYGILKTTVLTGDLAVYDCQYSSSTKADSLLKMIFGGDEFLSAYWHHQVIEAQVTLEDQAKGNDERTTRLKQIVQWRDCYDRVRSDFETFLEAEGIEILLYSELFAHYKWEVKLKDLVVETIVPKEDLEIVLSAMFMDADIFLTTDKGLVRKSFSLPLEPTVPAFCIPENLAQTLEEQEAGFKSFPDS